MAIEVPNSLGQSANDINDHHSENNNGNGHVAAQTTGSIKSKPTIETYTNNIPRIRIKAQFLPVIGLFVFYIAHDALQERMFRFEGFEFGFFMTLVEVVVMLVGSTISEGGYSTTGVGGMCSSITTTKSSKSKRKTLSIPVLIRISWVGLFLAIAHGLGNTSLKYSPYPLKVAFKSCKLVPTMAMGACVTGRQFSILQYTAALVMGMGLAVLTAADVFNSKQTVPLASNDSEWHKEIGPFIGPILLTISTVFDSIVPNLQEQLLQTHKVKTSEMILVSNMVMCFVLVLYTIYSGELILAWNYCASHRDASVVLFFQGLCAYFGLQSYLALIRDYGGVVGVLFANARKVLTIILSFLLFAKTFNERHLIGLVLVFIGVYLGYISKKGKKKNGAKSDGSGSSSPGRKKKRRERLRRSATDDSHEHHV